MLRLRFLAFVILVCGAIVSATALAERGGNKGGKGQGDTTVALCAEFNLVTAPYITNDGDGATYCDGDDGEILIGENVKLSTTTRNRNERTLSVDFNGTLCDDIVKERLDNGDELWIDSDAPVAMDGFFGWQHAKFVAGVGCNPIDPFSAAFGSDANDVNSLECLRPDGTELAANALTEEDGTQYMSWRVNMDDANSNFKKTGRALTMAYSGAFGPTECPFGDGDMDTFDGGLPIAIRCTSEADDGTCNSWRVRTFRACAFDYDTSRGGNVRYWGAGCPVNTDVSLRIK